MKTEKLKIIPGPYRVCSEKHDNGTLVIRSAPKGDGDVPGDLVVALIVGGAPDPYDLNTATLLAGAHDMRVMLEKCFAHLGAEIERKTLNESAADGTQALSREVAALLDAVAAPSNIAGHTPKERSSGGCV